MSLLLALAPEEWSLRKHLIRDKLAKDLKTYNDFYKENIKLPEHTYERRKNTHGTYFKRYNRIVFDIESMQNDKFDHVLNETVPHELAHAILRQSGFKGPSHGRKFKKTLEKLRKALEEAHPVDTD